MNLETRNRILSKNGRPLRFLLLALIDEIEKKMPNGFVKATERYFGVYPPLSRKIIARIDLQVESIQIYIDNKYVNYASSLNFSIGKAPDWKGQPDKLFGISLTEKENVPNVINLFLYIYGEQTGTVPPLYTNDLFEDSVDTSSHASKVVTSIENNYEEGDLIYRLSKQYERNPQVKGAAIRIHGLKCKICNFDFKKVYGEYGDGYIEVHHLTPLASGEGVRKIDPRNDLITICANCHRVVHRNRKKLLSPDELRNALKEQCALS